ncbi:MAG: T9SS type A sorting domain-containing protein [Saprospiraceae bacterium]
MNLKILTFLLIAGGTIKSQDFFSRVYTVPEDSTGLVNQWPNWLSGIFPTDSLIYAFGYSADTAFKEIYGTAFYVFDWHGNLLDFYHIKDDDTYNFFYPEGIQTWDGITFYTGFNLKNKQESILKFNRITREQKVLEIKNLLHNNGAILDNNLSADPRGFLITASRVETGIPNQWRKVQVTKMDTTGKILWHTIIGKEPITTFTNYPNSTYVDSNGFIYVGVGYTDDFGLGSPSTYESIFYKLDPDGKLVNSINSKPAQGFCEIYDIAQNEKGWFYLSSNYNYNDPPTFPTGNRGYGIVQILDSTLKYKGFIKLSFDSSYHGPSWNASFDKIIRTNSKDGFLLGGSLPLKDTIYQFIDSTQQYDTIFWDHHFLNLVKINDTNKVEWRKTYRIRNGKDDGYIYDIKSCPKGGYIIAAASYVDDAYEKFKDPYYMPWLLKIDDDGCLVPGCNIVSNKDLHTQKENEIRIYPNPASNYIILLHLDEHKAIYSIHTLEGKLIDQFTSHFQGEQIIIPLSNYTSGSYLIRGTYTNGSIASKIFIKE